MHFTCFILTATLTLWQGQKRTKNYLDMYRPQGNWIVDSNLCYWIINLLGVCCNQTPRENRIRLISTACVPNARVVWFPVLLWGVSFLFLQSCDIQVRSYDLWFNFWLFHCLTAAVSLFYCSNCRSCVYFGNYAFSYKNRWQNNIVSNSTVRRVKITHTYHTTLLTAVKKRWNSQIYY